jgi:hypothetical protein
LSRAQERIGARKRYWLNPLGIIRFAHNDLLSHNVKRTSYLTCYKASN